MGLVALSVLIVTVVALVAAYLVSLARHEILSRLASVAPAARVRWIVALLAVPAVTGVALLAIGLAPCVPELLAANGTDLDFHAEAICRFCLAHPRDVHGAVWVIAGACVVAACVRGAPTIRAIVQVRRLTTSLKQLRVRRPDGLWSIPGIEAFTVGWPRAEIYVGDILEHRVAPASVAAVIAHELAHVRRRDIGTKVLARALSIAFPRRAAQDLLGALDLAIEQACDAAASQTAGGALAVAQALVDVARLGHPDRSSFALGFVGDDLDARVRALCSPSWRSSTRLAVLAAGSTVAVVAVGLLLDHRIHSAIEALVRFGTR